MIGMGGDYPPGVSRVSPVRKFLDAVGESSPVVLGAFYQRDYRREEKTYEKKE